MKKLLLIIFLLIFSTSSFANISVINNPPQEAFEKKVNTLKNTLYKNPNDKETIDKYVNALSIRSNYYKRNKKNLEKASDDLRSALYFLSKNRGSDKYQEYSKRLSSILNEMNYYPDNSDSLELAKNLYMEEEYFASLYEFEKLANIGYSEYVCFEYMGDIYEKLNQNEEAQKYYLKSLEKYRNNENASYKLAKLYEKMGKYDLEEDELLFTSQIAKDKDILNEIINIYNRKAVNEPNNIMYYEILANANKSLGNYQSAYMLLNKALNINKDDTTIKYELGNILYEMGKYQDAINAYNSILLNNPYESQIRINKAKCLKKLGRIDEAIKEYQVVLAIYPDNLQAQYGIYGLVSYYNDVEIIRKFYPLKNDAKPNSKMFEELASFAQDMDDTKGAINLYNISIKLDNKNANSYIGLYKAYELLDNKIMALETIKKAYEKNPNNTNIIEMYKSTNKEDIQRKDELALEYLKINDWAHALKIYEGINPKTSAIYSSMANCNGALKRYKEAKENLENAIKLDPANSDLYYMLALNLLEQNSPVSAKKELIKALNLDKNNIKAQKLLNSIARREINGVLKVAGDYYDKKQFDLALKELNRGLETYGGYLQLFYYRGMVYEAQGKKMEALSDYKKVTEIDNNYDPVYYSLGRLLEKMGKERDALSAFERYLSGTPDDRDSERYAQKRIIELGNKYY